MRVKPAAARSTPRRGERDNGSSAPIVSLLCFSPPIESRTIPTPRARFRPRIGELPSCFPIFVSLSLFIPFDAYLSPHLLLLVLARYHALGKCRFRCVACMSVISVLFLTYIIAAQVCAPCRLVRGCLRTSPFPCCDPEVVRSKEKRRESGRRSRVVSEQARIRHSLAMIHWLERDAGRSAGAWPMQYPNT